LADNCASGAVIRFLREKYQIRRRKKHKNKGIIVAKQHKLINNSILKW